MKKTHDVIALKLGHLNHHGVGGGGGYNLAIKGYYMIYPTLTDNQFDKVDLVTIHDETELDRGVGGGVGGGCR